MILVQSRVQNRNASQYFKIVESLFNSLPNDKFLDWSKLKGLADDKLNVAEKLKFALQRVENHGRNNLIFKILLIAIDRNFQELHHYPSIKS